jgi:hypothetical protein
MRSSIITAAAAAVIAGALSLAAVSTAGATTRPAVKSYTSTATTAVSNRPDSGDHGDWARDTFTRTAKVTLVSEVALSYCGGSTGTGHCYDWTGSVSDSGSFTTIPGGVSPGNGSLNGGLPPAISTAVKGTMAGTYRYAFYSSWKTASAALVATHENDAGNTPGGRSTTGAWPEQFFGAGAKFYVSGAVSSELGTTGSWKYTAAFGADAACPAIASSWTDASPDWGANAIDGNILAPAGC